MSPAQARLRQDEIARAHEVRVESEPGSAVAPAPVARPDVERTIADDCAAMLDAWFEQMAMHGKAVVLRQEVDNLARRMRNMGVMAKYSQAVGKL